MSQTRELNHLGMLEALATPKLELMKQRLEAELESRREITALRQKETFGRIGDVFEDFPDGFTWDLKCPVCGNVRNRIQAARHEEVYPSPSAVAIHFICGAGHHWSLHHQSCDATDEKTVSVAWVNVKHRNERWPGPGEARA